MDRKWLTAGVVAGIVVGIALGPLMAGGVFVALFFADDQGNLRGQQQGGSGGVVTCDVGSMQVEAADSSGTTETYDEVQLNHAAEIIQAGNTAAVGQQGQLVALMTSLQESRLRNLANPAVEESMGLPNDGQGADHDSVGLFQQRPSMGWGTVQEIMTPSKSASTFYERLKGVDGWESMSPGRAAQSVQASAFPDAYDKWEPTARTIMSALSGVQCSDTGTAKAVAGVEGGRAAIIAFAQAQVGKAYVWAAEGPDSFDCSGLTMKAYEQAGIQLEHSSGSQYSAGEHVAAGDARPGDLLWWPGHVALYTGDGRMIGAQSPAEGIREMAVYGSPVYIRVPGLD